MQLFGGLVRLGDDLEPTPDIAAIGRQAMMAGLVPSIPATIWYSAMSFLASYSLVKVISSSISSTRREATLSTFSLNLPPRASYLPLPERPIQQCHPPLSSPRHLSTSFFYSTNWRIIVFALAWSGQKPGWADCFARLAISSSLVTMSKIDQRQIYQISALCPLGKMLGGHAADCASSDRGEISTIHDRAALSPFSLKGSVLRKPTY